MKSACDDDTDQVLLVLNKDGIPAITRGHNAYHAYHVSSEKSRVAEKNKKKKIMNIPCWLRHKWTSLVLAHDFVIDVITHWNTADKMPPSKISFFFVKKRVVENKKRKIRGYLKPSIECLV